MSPTDSEAEASFDGVHADVDPLTAAAGSRFVIHQHHATALHHDLRLEMLNGVTPVLVSWAVPKGLPRQRGQRHLAIHVEDHDIGYASFTGTIPEGQYGGGEVRIFDEGVYELVDRSSERITFRLNGRRLSGIWHLIHTGVESGRDQWLAIMSQDLREPAEVEPAPIPMLATSTAAAFDDPEWWFEPKWGGLRAISLCDEGTRLISSTGEDITVAYPELGRIHNQLVALDAMLDGEIVALEGGMPSSRLLMHRMRLHDAREIEEAARKSPVVYMAFDLLYLDGADLTGRALAERRELLQEVIVPSSRISLSPVTEGDGVVLFKAVDEQGLAGVVAKKRTSTYRPGATSLEWLEVMTPARSDRGQKSSSKSPN